MFKLVLNQLLNSVHLTKLFYKTLLEGDHRSYILVDMVTHSVMCKTKWKTSWPLWLRKFTFHLIGLFVSFGSAPLLSQYKKSVSLSYGQCVVSSDVKFSNQKSWPSLGPSSLFAISTLIQGLWGVTQGLFLVLQKMLQNFSFLTTTNLPTKD